MASTDSISGADMVIGYRVKRADPPMRLVNAWGWKQLVNGLFGYTARDVDCAFVARLDVIVRAFVELFLLRLHLNEELVRDEQAARLGRVTHVPA